MRNVNIISVVLSTFILCSISLSHAKTYQCTDAQGQVSFSNLPCPETADKKILEYTDSQGAIEIDDSKNYIDVDTASPLCLSAVENAQYTLEQMLSVGKRNYQGGYLEKDEYERGELAITAATTRITLSRCEASQGEDREFFECLEDGYTLMPMCAAQFKPSFLEDI